MQTNLAKIRKRTVKVVWAPPSITERASVYKNHIPFHAFPFASVLHFTFIHFTSYAVQIRTNLAIGLNHNRKILYILHVIPTTAFQHKYLDIDSDMFPTSVSDIYSDILSDIYSGILFAILSDICSGILSDKYFSDSIWHSIWHIIWHSIWHIFWHSIWHIFWHSICMQSDIYFDSLPFHCS